MVKYSISLRAHFYATLTMNINFQSCMEDHRGMIYYGAKVCIIKKLLSDTISVN
jgi:hypothetical protein